MGGGMGNWMNWRNGDVYDFRRNGDVYDFMLFFNPYIEIFQQEIKTFKEKHKIIDVPFIPVPFIPICFSFYKMLFCL